MIPLWNELSADAGLTLSDAQLKQLDLYLELLIETNQTMNLTRISDRADAEIRHVADALTLLPLLPPVRKATADHAPRRHTLADVGTGGGIPGVILAIARPDLAVTLIDATAKKLNAVHRMCDTLGLENVKSIHGRMEETKLQFDIITARGVAKLGKLLMWCRPLMKPSGVLLAMKGPKVIEEIANFPPQLRRRFRLVHHPVKPAQLAGHVNIEVRLGKEKT